MFENLIADYTENPTSGGFSATYTEHPGFTGEGLTQEEALADLQEKINEVAEGTESTGEEGESEDREEASV